MPQPAVAGAQLRVEELNPIDGTSLLDRKHVSVNFRDITACVLRDVATIVRLLHVHRARAQPRPPLQSMHTRCARASLAQLVAEHSQRSRAEAKR